MFYARNVTMKQNLLQKAEFNSINVLKSEDAKSVKTFSGVRSNFVVTQPETTPQINISGTYNFA